MNRYDEITQDEFKSLIEDVANEMGIAQVLAIPGVYEIVSEYLNNAALELWDSLNPVIDEQ
jgi:hypothetical protein